MADDWSISPERIARLRNEARLEQVDPARILEAATPLGDGPIVDVGAGVGYVTLPFAARFPDRRIVAVDILAPMLELLAEDARERGLGNVETAVMETPTALPLPSGQASMLTMLQVHHELEDAQGLMQECKRVLAPGAPIVIVDWKDEDLPGMPQGGRRVSVQQIMRDLEVGGFHAVASKDIYPIHSTVVGRAL